MALRSVAFRNAGGVSLLSLLSSASCRHFSPSACRFPRLRLLASLSERGKLAPFPGLLKRCPADGVRCFSVNRTASSLNDPSPNWSNRPPKETILLDGCDFEHWLVVVEPPDPNLTRDEIIKSYIQTLAKVVGSEEEARFKIYSVSTKHYFAFGALVSEELSYKLKELPGVRWVLPDSYLDVKNKDYGGEPFINGEAVPYDPKYHEEWVRNNARAMERNRRNDRPRNFDRSRNFERRRENMQNFANRTPPPMQNQDLGNHQPNQGPVNPVNPGYTPGPGSMPPPVPGQAPQSSMPPPLSSQNPQSPVPSQSPLNSMPPPPRPGQNTQIPLPNMGGPSYMGYQNQMPGHNPIPPPNQMPGHNPIPPPMPGQNFQPGVAPRNAPNYAPPNRDSGFQNQMPNYQNGPQSSNPSYSGAGNPYQSSNTYPASGNAYQGAPPSYQGGTPPGYQGSPTYHGSNPGPYQPPTHPYPSNNIGGVNANQGKDGSDGGPYQGQNSTGGRY